MGFHTDHTLRILLRKEQKEALFELGEATHHCHLSHVALDRRPCSLRAGRGHSICGPAGKPHPTHPGPMGSMPRAVCLPPEDPSWVRQPLALLLPLELLRATAEGLWQAGWLAGWLWPRGTHQSPWGLQGPSCCTAHSLGSSRATRPWGTC